ncbi:MAG: Ig-like domain-containing protein [Fimbriiglobus sp.]
MPQSKPTKLTVLNLEDRITPAYNPQVVFDYINSMRITSTTNTNSIGGIFSTWAQQGSQADPNQRIVDPREAGYAVQGLLNSSIGNVGDALGVAQLYILWYLNNVDLTDFTIDQQWYRSDGTFVRATEVAGDDATAGVFLQTVWQYVQKGGDRNVLTSPTPRSKLLGVMQLLTRLQQSDGLTSIALGSQEKLLANNAEAYAGLLSTARLLSEAFDDNALAATFDEAANRLRNGIQTGFYVNETSGYGWRKFGTGIPETVDNPFNPWSSTVARMWPALFGVDDPRGSRSTAQLDTINANYTGSKSWVTGFPDSFRDPWTVMGHISHLVTGNPANTTTHNDFIFDNYFTSPSQPVQPFTVDDAAWMLRSTNAPNRAPVADSVLPVTLDQGTTARFNVAGSDPDGTPVRFSIVGRPSSGSVNSDSGDTIFTANTEFIYTPNVNFSGTDSIQFKVSDGEFDSEFVTINFTVNAVNTVPPPPTTPPTTPPIPGVPPRVPPPVIIPSPPGVPPIVVIPPVPPSPPLPALNRSMTVVSSSDPGNTVTIITATGEFRNTIPVFENPISGGVKGTLENLNSDSVADLLVGTGSGVPTQIRGLDGVDNSVLFRIAPYEPSFTGGVFIATGDINGDRTPDIIISPDQGGGPRVRVYNGATLEPIVDFLGIADPNFRGGARVTAGDFNADGFADLVVAAGFGGGPRVTIWDGKALAQGKQVQLANFFAFESSLRNGVYVSAGIFRNDAREDSVDLAVGAGPGGGPRVSVFGGRELLQNSRIRIADFFAGDTSERGGVTVSAKRKDPRIAIDSEFLPPRELVTGPGPGTTVRKMNRYANVVASTDFVDITEPLDGNVSGIFVG